MFTNCFNDFACRSFTALIAIILLGVLLFITGCSSAPPIQIEGAEQVIVVQNDSAYACTDSIASGGGADKINNEGDFDDANDGSGTSPDLGLNY